MANRPSRLERITNLVLVLLDSPRPLPLREIGRTVAGYPSEHGALRQAFERDKKTLRDGGIPVSAEPIGGQDQYGYRILPEHYYLPDLGLDADEEAEVAFAVAAVRLEGGFGADALAKLGLAEPVVGRPLAMLPSLPALGPLHEAVRRRCQVRFAYRGRERVVEPYGLAFRSGAWYLVGHDRGAGEGGARRTFRVDRLESPPALGAAGAFEPPSLDLAAELRLAPVLSASAGGDQEAPLEVVLDVDAREASLALAAVGPAALRLRRPDGSVRLACPVADEAAFARWVAGFGASAEVVGPPVMRRAVVALLEAAAGGGAHAELDRAGPAAPPAAPALAVPLEADARPGAADRPAVPVPGSLGVAAASGASANLDAGARLRRLLAVLAHLARVGEAPIADLAARFGLEPAALVAELELAACCGLPPYTPDQLLELVVDDDRVRAYHLSALGRPSRLTPEEGFAVAAAARALLGVSGSERDGPLARGLAKLERALGEASLDVAIERPPLLQPLLRAAAGGEVLDLVYLDRAGIEQQRRVEPYAVVVREGRWYLDAWSSHTGNWRRFLVAHVRSVSPTGIGAPARTAPAAFAGARAFVAGPDARRAVVELPEQLRGALDRVAAAPAQPGVRGRVVVPLDVADEAWFGRLLLGLPEARVLEPRELADAAAPAARAALRRYRAAGRPERGAAGEPSPRARPDAPGR